MLTGLNVAVVLRKGQNVAALSDGIAREGISVIGESLKRCAGFIAHVTSDEGFTGGSDRCGEVIGYIPYQNRPYQER